MEKDYSHLLKREVRCISDGIEVWDANGEHEITGIVIGIDFNIGITIIDVVTGKEIVCLNKKDADGGSYSEQKPYEQMFKDLVQAIEDGIYYSPDSDSLNSSACAFSSN